MTAKHSNLRLRMLLTTASAALVAMPSAAHAQLVSSGDLVSAEDSAGNPGQLTITNPDAVTANISVLAPVVVANWNQFNVPGGTTLNVTNASAAAQASLLNRVIGGNFSDIGGTINALGVNLWLVNQNGILFGSDTSVNASSFFASTLDVSDADFFDYYEGTDLAGNGSQTVRFSGAGTSGIFGGGGTASFVTDGSLFFTGPALDLDATFNAGTGSVTFVAARDLSVSFNAGSPVSYAINSGTTVAQQRIGGSVSGNSANFVLVTDAAVVNGLLQVDADVTTTAVPSANGVFLVAAGAGADKPDLLVNGSISSTGVVSAVAQGDATFNDSVTGSAVILPVAGALTTKDVTATAGDLTLSGTSVTGDALSATGNVSVDSAGSVSLGSARADSDLNGAGDLAIGTNTLPSTLTISGTSQGANVDLQASGDLALQDVIATAGSVGLESTAGAISVADIVAPGNIDVTGMTSAAVSGGVTSGGSYTVSANTVTLGDSGVPVTQKADGSVTITGTTNSVNGLSGLTLQSNADGIGGEALTISAGTNVVFTGDTLLLGGDPNGLASNRSDVIVSTGPAGLLQLGDVTAKSLHSPMSANLAQPRDIILGNVIVDDTLTVSSATRSVQTGNITVRGPGAGLTITAASEDILTGNLAANGDVVLEAGNTVSSGSINALGAIDVDSTGGGNLTLGILNAGTSIDLDTAGSLSANAVSAGGAFTVGAAALPASATFGGNVSAASVDLNVTGALSALGITSTAGGIDIDAGSIAATAVSATGGDAQLTAAGNITTSSISSTGAIDVDSAGGGDLNLGTLNAGTSISLDTAGNLSAGAASAGGAFTVGAAALPSTATFAGNVSGASIDFDVAGGLTAQGIVSTAGAIDIDAGSISAAGVSATGGDATLTAAGAITTSSVTSTAAIDVDSTGGGDLSLGTISAGTDAVIDTTGGLTTNGVTAGGAFAVGGVAAPSAATFKGNIRAANVDLDVTGAVSAKDIVATAGGIDIDAGAIAALALSATDDIQVDSPGAIMLASAMADSDADGVGDLAIGANTLPASLSVTGLASGVSVDLQATANVRAGSVTSTAGAIDIDSTMGSIFAGAVDATGGDASLTAFANVTTASINSTAAIDVDSTNAGNLDLGTLTAGTDINLDTAGIVTAGATTAGGALTVGATTEPYRATFTGNISAASVDLNAADALITQNVASTAGDVRLDAGSINSVAVSTVGGDAILTATGNITTASINSSNSIDVDSTNGGSLSLGTLDAGADIALDTTGAITAGTTTAGGTLAVGGIAVPARATFTGDISAAAIDIDAVGAFIAQGITATAGDIDIDAGSVNAGALSATDDVFVDAAGNIVLASARADSDASGAGNLAIGATTLPSKLTVTGASQGVAVDLQASGNVTLGSVTSTAGVVDIDSTAGSISTAAVTATGGDALLTAAQNVTATGAISGRNVDIDAGGALNALGITATAGDIDIDAGSVNAGALSATDDVFVDAAGAIVLASARADSDASGAGNLAIGANTLPSSLSVTGASQGVAVDLQASGNVTLGSVTSTGGVVDIDSTAGSISTAAISASGGDALLTAAQNVTTASVTSSDAIDVDSLGGGNLNLGPLTAGTDITIDTAGNITAGATLAGGMLTVGGTTVPARATFTGDISATNVDIDAAGALTALAITATTGDIDIDAGSVSAGALSAADDVFVDAAGAIALGSARADSDGNGAGNLAIGATTLPASLSITGASQGVTVDLQASGNVALGAVTSTNGAVDIDSASGSITAAAVTATGGDALLTAARDVTTGAVTSTSGNVDIDSTAGSISTGAVTAAAGNVLLTAAQNCDCDRRDQRAQRRYRRGWGAQCARHHRDRGRHRHRCRFGQRGRTQRDRRRVRRRGGQYRARLGAGRQRCQRCGQPGDRGDYPAFEADRHGRFARGGGRSSG